MRYRTTILVLIVFHFAGYPRLLSAESKTIIVQPHDSLSSIVSTHYPTGVPTSPVMQAIVARNPEAFINNNIHRLISGKQLVLPEFAGISPLNQTAPSSSASQTSSVTGNEAQTSNPPPLFNERINHLEALRLQLTTQITQLKANNQSLQQQLTRYETEKKDKDTAIRALTEQVTQLENALNTNNSEKNQQSSDMAASIARIQAENQSLQQQLTRTKQALDTQAQENQRLTEQLTRLNKQPSSTSAYYWLWGLGLLGLLLGLFWLLLKSRNTAKRPSQQTNALTTPIIVDAEPITPLSIAETDTTKPNARDESYIKLNIARAYMDMRMPEAAVDLLEEVIREGNPQQKQQAQEILSFIA